MKNKDQKDTIIDFITSLNHTISDFLSTNKDPGSENLLTGITKKNIRSDDNNPFTIHHYLKFKQCDDTDCSCHTDHHDKCWLIENTHCQNPDQAYYSGTYHNCDTCDIFRKHTEIIYNSLQSNIEKLLTHFESRIDLLNEDTIKDNLTGLYTHHYLKLIRNREIERASRQNQPVSVIFFSLNRFKDINQNYGHLVGDEVLKEFSHFLLDITRNEDLVFRTGSDQFMLFMVGAEEKHRKRVETRLDEANKIWKDKVKNLPVRLSFSFGGATNTGSINLDHLMVQAGTKMEQYRLLH